MDQAEQWAPRMLHGRMPDSVGFPCRHRHQPLTGPCLHPSGSRTGPPLSGCKKRMEGALGAEGLQLASGERVLPFQQRNGPQRRSCLQVWCRQQAARESAARVLQHCSGDVGASRACTRPARKVLSPAPPRSGSESKTEHRTQSRPGAEPRPVPPLALPARRCPPGHHASRCSTPSFTAAGHDCRPSCASPSQKAQGSQPCWPASTSYDECIGPSHQAGHSPYSATCIHVQYTGTCCMHLISYRAFTGAHPWPPLSP